MIAKKHCPFCGATNKFTLIDGVKPGTTCYACTGCWAKGPEAESAHGALVLWNTRTAAPKKRTSKR